MMMVLDSHGGVTVGVRTGLKVQSSHTYHTARFGSESLS